MTTEHYNYLKLELSKLDINAIRLETLNSGKQPRNMQKLIMWNCLYIAGLSEWICANLYSYLNDDNITSALNSIFKEFNQFA